MNSKGTFVGLFVFIIFSLVIVMFAGIFIYIGNETEDQLDRVFNDRSFGTRNSSQIVDSTIGQVNNAFSTLYWITLFLIVAQIISFLIGSFLVTTRPVFFVPFLFLMIIVIIMGAGVSNAYEDLIATPELTGTFSGFIGTNEIMLNLPFVLTVIGFIGAIIMFSQLGKGRQLGLG